MSTLNKPDLHAKMNFARIYQEIILERFDVSEEFLDGVLLLVEREELGNVCVQAIHVLKHILQDLVGFSGFSGKWL